MGKHGKGGSNPVAPGVTVVSKGGSGKRGTGTSIDKGKK